jgi:hypothetical protein
MTRTWGDFEIELGRKLVKWLQWMWTLQFLVSFYYEKMPATLRPHNRPCTRLNNNAATHWGLNASSRFVGASRDSTRPMRLTCTHGAASTSLSLASGEDKCWHAHCRSRKHCSRRLKCPSLRFDRLITVPRRHIMGSLKMRKLRKTLSTKRTQSDPDLS